MADSAPSQEEDLEGEGSVGGGSSATGWSSQSEYLYTSDEESRASTIRSNTSRIHRRRRKVPKASDRPKLIVSVGLCYLGLVLLRVAISLGDLHRWVEEQGLVYLRAISEVPAKMKERLDPTYWYALDPKVCMSSSVGIHGFLMTERKV
jgi:RNA polymerase I-specific transcription initiation factor RRN7